jgi:enoyl-CoA hydratase/carnithine racemase
VVLDHSGPVATMTLHNAPLNLLTTSMRIELIELTAQLRVDSDVRAVLLTADGETAFCAGSDISEFPRDERAGRRRARLEHACYDAIESLPQPVVVALRGYTLGGGVELALAADLRIGDPTLKVSLPEVRLGLFPSGGGTQRLPRLIGASRAKDLMYRGRMIDAEACLQWGIIDALDPDDAFRAARELAMEIAEQPTGALRAIKHTVRVGLTEGVVAGSQLEEDLICELFTSADALEGTAAFKERREPHFHGRRGAR